MDFIDIHTHTYYNDNQTKIILNAFPYEKDKFELPVHISLGIHPWHVNEDSWKNELEILKRVVDNNNVIAIGETGLDKFVNNDFSLQKVVFREHLKISEEKNKPLIIHCVRAYDQLLAFRKKSFKNLPWIIHWFNANETIAKELINNNCYLSFGHMLFNEKSKAFKIFTSVNLRNVFFETDDAGYTIKDIYQRAAEIKNLSIDDLKKAISYNFAQCFKI